MFYGHTGVNPPNPTYLYVIWDCRQADERATYPTATTTYEDWAFSEGDVTNDSMFSGQTTPIPQAFERS